LNKKEAQMAEIRGELVKMLNQALELEHAARVQYLAQAELIKGLEAEKIIQRLKEIASDEEKHEEIFRKLIASYLDGEPSMKIAPTKRAKETLEILKVNIEAEEDAVDFYKQIYEKIIENKKILPYEFETLEHGIRHIIMDEQEHITELALLLGR